MLDESTLCLAIGDVSGKGVPAALFMAVTRTLLRRRWRHDPSPATALTRVNAEIVRDNPRTMFVSLFCATVDLRRGEVRYASGGHNPPFVTRAGGQVTSLPRVKGTIIGIGEGVTCEEGRLSLHAGDALLLYTDGVTEATDSTGEFFGAVRTAETLTSLARGPAGESREGLVAGARAALADFAQQAEQYDDIAMLSFRYRQPPPPAGGGGPAGRPSSAPGAQAPAPDGPPRRLAAELASSSSGPGGGWRSAPPGTACRRARNSRPAG